MPIRIRLALLCAVATLLVLAGGGLVFLRQLQAGLNANLDTSLRTRAEAVLAQVSNAEGPDFQDAGAGTLLRSADSIAEVMSTAGAVLQGSDLLGGRPLLTARQAATAARGPITLDATVDLPGPGGTRPAGRPRAVRLLAVPAGPTGRVVVVGTSREVVDAALERTGQELLALGAVALLLAAGGAYLLARAALRPVERMRAQAEDLGTHDAGAGLAVPGTRDEVSRLASTMNALLGRLHEALARERTFVADAGHELRTPLTILAGELELARRPGRSQEELAETVEVAARETARLIRLSEDLLLLARTHEGPFLRVARTDLVAVASAAVAAGSALAALRRVALVVVGPGDVWAVVDADRVRQALDNLVSNALRHAPPGSTVRVAVRSKDNAAEIAVLDEGPGFPPDFLPVAFERFRRADAARTRAAPGDGGEGAGSGLGLAIVRGIAQAHGGTAVATNRAGGGAAVTLLLPAAAAPDRPAPLDAAPEPSLPRGRARL